jgi:hypothetical protein
MNLSEDRDNIDIEEYISIVRPTKPSHVDFDKSKIKGGHIEVLNYFGYIDNVDWVRLGGGELVPNPKEDEVVVFQSFLNVDLRFPLHKMIVALLKRFNIYLHQLTPNTIVRLEIFIWVVQSPVAELDVEAFYEAFSQIHELHFQMKVTRDLHNNFGCYNFASRRGSMFMALAYRSKWSNEWVKEWFYMKNDLTAWVDIKGIIHTSIVTSFGYKKSTCIYWNEGSCSVIFSFKKWSLAVEWKIPMMFEKDASDAKLGMVRLCYKYKFEDEFGEPSEGLIDYVEAKCSEILGNYSKPEAKALQQAFGARKRR